MLFVAEPVNELETGGLPTSGQWESLPQVRQLFTSERRSGPGQMDRGGICSAADAEPERAWPKSKALDLLVPSCGS